jgi:hypothetical protein
MRHPSLLLALVIALSGCTVSFGGDQQGNEPANAGSEDQQKSVIAAAHRIVDLFDQDRFDDAWPLVGPMLQSRTSKAAFSSSVKALRKPLGTAGHRDVKGFNFLEAVDGVTGEFGLVAVETDFENAKSVEEKFVFQKIGGEWKLAGYWLSKKVTLGAN